MLTIWKACGWLGHVFAASASPRTSKHNWLCHRRLLFMAVSMITNIRHSRIYCTRRSWLTHFGAIFLNHPEPTCSTRFFYYSSITTTLLVYYCYSYYLRSTNTMTLLLCSNSADMLWMHALSTASLLRGGRSNWNPRWTQKP